MMENDAGREGLRLKIEINDVNLISSVVEMEEDGVGSARYENEGKLWEIEEESNVGFARQKPGVTKVGCYGIKKQKLKKVSVEDNKKKHSRVELGKLFQSAVSFHDWDFAESLILLVDPLILNDFLCISLDSIWFLRTHEELIGIVGLIKKTMSNGAFDFTRAALRTSFLASCVSACRSQTMSLADTVTVMGDRLHERLQECNVNNILKAEAASKVQKFTEWALKCIGFHSRCHGNRDKTCHDSAAETYLQLSAFKTFLHLAGNNLTGKDFTEAFDAACFPLTLFSSWFDPGWSSGASANIIQGLLTILVDGGADNVNQCFLEASRFGSSELVCILLQIAQRNSLDVDVDLALGFASHYGKISTMDCLVKEGNAKAFLGPLMRASERGCLLVVQWFVQRGCQDMELCLALTAATSSGQVEVAAFLLPQVPQQVLAALSIEILKAAGERSDASFEGVSFLLHSNFLGDAAITYSVADSIARSEDGSVGPDLQAFFRDHWSEAAFIEGQFIGQEHFVNMIRVLNRGESPLRIGDLPMPMRVAIAYLPLYRECVKAGGCLLSQRLRGELMEAVRRLGGVVLREPSQNQKLVAILRYHLRPFLPGLNLTCSCKQTTLRQQMDGV